MAALHLVSGFIAVSCTIAWSFGDKVNVNFETKYDNNHNELKQLLTEHKTFQSHNWTHYAFLIQLIVCPLVLAIILIYAYRRYGPILKLICCGQQQHNHHLNKLPTITSSYSQPPYANTLHHLFNQTLPQHNSPASLPRDELTTSLHIPPHPVVS